MINITVLKLGGSVLTDKKRTHAVNTRDIKRIGGEIKSALNRKPQKLILVHGAGGAPHKLARDYFNYKKQDAKKTRLALKTHMKVQELNTELAKILQLSGIPVMPVHTSSIFTVTSTDKPQLTGLPIIRNLIAGGVIPLLYGDMIMKPNGQFQVLSGDTIAMILAGALQSQKIIFATDVDGVYADVSKKILLQKLNASSIKTLLRDWRNYKSVDATGDLPGKVAAISKKPKHSAVIITNGLKPKNIYKCLTGKPVGTVIK